MNDYTVNDAQADRNRGKQDAQRKCPAIAEGDYPFRDEVLAEAKQTYIENSESTRIKQYEQDLIRVDKELISAENRRRQIEEEERRLKGRANRLYGEASHGYEQEKRGFDEAEREIRLIMSTLNRLPHKGLPTAVYALFITALILAEIPINYAVLEHIFQERMAAILAGCLLIGALLLLVAHYVGKLLRQTDFESWQTQKLRLASAFILIVFAAWLVSVIADVREIYIEHVHTADTGTLFSMSAHAAETPETTTKEDIQDMGQLILLLNAGVFLAGLLLSFFHHDPELAYEQAIKKRKKHKKRMKMRMRVYAMMVKRIKAETRKGTIEDQKFRLNLERTQIEGDLEVRQTKELELVEKLRSIATLRLTNYQRGYLENLQTGNPIPECFKQTNVPKLINRGFC
jgi:hypothetical protein